MCSAANTAYTAAYRQAYRAGRPPLGAHVPGTEATQTITQLLEEGYRKGEIARWLGHRWPMLHWQPGDGVTLRTTLRLRRLARHLDV